MMGQGRSVDKEDWQVAVLGGAANYQWVETKSASCHAPLFGGISKHRLERHLCGTHPLQEKLRKATTTQRISAPDLSRLKTYAEKLAAAEAELDSLRLQLEAAQRPGAGASTSTDPVKRVGRRGA